MQEDIGLARRLREAAVHGLEVRRTPRGQSAQALWQSVCAGGEGVAVPPEAPLLLLPDGFSLLPGEGIPQARSLLCAASLEPLLKEINHLQVERTHACWEWPCLSSAHAENLGCRSK
jgi:hypothetical protein